VGPSTGMGGMVIKLSTTFAKEVVTGLVYLGITSVDGVEYSGLMIDAKRIVGMRGRLSFPIAAVTWSVLTWNCRRTKRGTLCHSICDHRPSPSALIPNHCQSYAHGLMDCH